MSNEDASKKILVATGIVVFDFELFIGGLFQSNRELITWLFFALS